MVLKNVENKIKLVTIVCSIFLAGCIVISLGAVFTARQMVNDAHKQIYVLDSNVPILVKQTPQEMTLDIEAKADIDMFHHLFFTLAPDDKYIRYTIDKAMYLVDETGLAQYNRDSLTFTYYGRQRIERRSTILWRQLITAGQLKRVPRTENNPYGLLIINWRTLLNKDLEERKKSDY